jgi:hypothetical protein
MRVKLKRPETLVEGQRYLWQENARSANGGSFHRVTFVSYYPCPAFVIVLDEEGRKRRCLREEIFTPETTSQDRRLLSLARVRASSNLSVS